MQNGLFDSNTSHFLRLKTILDRSDYLLIANVRKKCSEASMSIPIQLSIDNRILNLWDCVGDEIDLIDDSRKIDDSSSNVKNIALFGIILNILVLISTTFYNALF